MTPAASYAATLSTPIDRRAFGTPARPTDGVHQPSHRGDAQ